MKTAAIVLALALGVSCDTLGGHSGHHGSHRQGRQEEAALDSYAQPGYEADLDTAASERVPISWTNQHGAGTYQLKESEIILQYTCDPLMRDGTTTSRIPDNPTECQDYNCDTDVEYGRHESWKSYQYCKATSRNKGLFTANQNLNNRNAAKYTRQDNDGTRYG